MEILEQRIRYNDKTYKVGEPTLDVYMAIQKQIEYADNVDLAVSLISWVTGLTREQVKDAEAYSVVGVAESILTYYNNAGEQFYNNFEFNGKHYKFLDMKNMTFGEYVDIDTFLQKPNAVKQTKLNELMAMLYRELDEEGNYKPYDITQVQTRAVEFNKLPLKYFNGCLVFFYLIANTSLSPTRLFLLRQRLRRAYWKLQRITKTLLVGIVQLLPWRGRTYSKRRLL